MKEVIIWDFDGVIVDSMNIRSDAFRYALDTYSSIIVDDLLSHHLENGGKSRYEKFERIISRYPEEEMVMKNLLNRYSKFIDKNLFNHSILNDSIYTSIKLNERLGVQQYIASGSDEVELRRLIEFLNVDKYFKGVYGSPKRKHLIVDNIIKTEARGLDQYLLIGDSKNDMEAAKMNGIDFCMYTINDGVKDERIFS